MTEREALKLALEALEEAWYHVGTFQPTEKAIDLYDEARTAIKEALAQPEQKPVAFINVEQRKLEWAKYMTWDTPTVVNLPKIPLYTTPAHPWEKFCDSNCVWTDHHPDCKLAEQEPVAWVPYLSDRADGVSGHYAIARRNPRGYREVWNLRRHAWGAYSDDVLSLEEADTLLRLIEIPTRKVETPQPAQQEPVAWAENDGEGNVLWDRESCFSDDPEWLDNPMPLYTTPPQRKPLTDEEIILIVAECASSHQHTDIHFARAIEAALRSKNT